MSPSKTALLHASPSDAFAGAADVGSETCVKPTTGVLIKETVGRAAASKVGEATPDVSIVGKDASVVSVRAITGSGPGGQHVNTASTRIELRWNGRSTRALSQ